jgi:hypothetical protein
MDILGRVFGLMVLLSINVFVCLVTGYLYFTDKHYLASNDQWVWIAVFFLSQLFGFLVIDMIVLLFNAFIVAKCCRRWKLFLACFFKESLYVYEDVKFVAEFSRVQDFTP